MVFESEWVWLTLLAKRLEFCAELARQRQANAEEEERRAWQASPATGPEAERVHYIGLCGEAAAMIYLSPIKWHTFKRGRLDGLPDLGTCIDVKSTPADYGLAVQSKNNPDWIYVAAWLDLPRVALVGWCYGKEVKIEANWKKLKFGAYFVKYDDPVLRPMVALRRELERDPSLRGATYPARSPTS